MLILIDDDRLLVEPIPGICSHRDALMSHVFNTTTRAGVTKGTLPGVLPRMTTVPEISWVF